MASQQRFDLIDVLRGLAVVQMMFYHFCFLLKEFKLAFIDFSNNVYWQNFRTLIVIQFLCIVGISLKIAMNAGFNQKSYFGRLLQLFIYASIVSFTTYLLQPPRMVIFGILQFIFVASIVALPFTRLTWQNLIVGVILCWIGVFFSATIFDQQWLHWIGLMTRKPFTFDYVPLLPWFGLVLIGLYLGQLISSHPRLAIVRRWRSELIVNKMLRLIGLHSLNLYMAHMPIFYAFIYFVLV